MDFSHYPDSNRFYDGSERKKGILIDDQPYIIKFRKNSGDGLRYNHVSEYIGSHMFQLMGLDCHETCLGTYRGEEVVALKDFVGPDECFVPFNAVGESSLDMDKERFQYSYHDIVTMLHANMKLTNVTEMETRFWDMFVVDAWIGNFDRHGGNWGFLKKNNNYRCAPVFDNGSCLFPALNTDELLKKVMLDESEISMRIKKFPTSQILLNGKKSSYYDVIHSCQFGALNKAILRIVPRIRSVNWSCVIEEIDVISEERKKFYILMLKRRFEEILYSTYCKLKNSGQEPELCCQ